MLEFTQSKATQDTGGATCAHFFAQMTPWDPFSWADYPPVSSEEFWK